MINNSNIISGSQIREFNVKKRSSEIDLSDLIEKSINLSYNNKKDLVDLIYYLNVGLRSRYSNFPIKREGVINCLEKIFGDENNVDLDKDIDAIFSMCTHSNTMFDSVTSFTRTAEGFIKSIGSYCDIEELEKIKIMLDSGLKLGANQKFLDLFIRCANYDLSGANLSKINLSNVALSGVNLSQTKLLIGTNLNRNIVYLGSNIAARNFLNWYDLMLPNFTGAVLNNTTINLLLLSWPDAYEVDLFFNHIKNSKSVLTTIESIDANYNTLKVELMMQVINWLNKEKINVASFAMALEDVFYNNPIYLENETIKKFSIDKLLPIKIELAKRKPIVFKDLEVKFLSQEVINLSNNANINNNNIPMQLL